MRGDVEPETMRPRSPLRLAGVVLCGLASALVAPGCINDPDCGICDPQRLVLESISGVNYANRKVHLLDPQCSGDACPSSFDSGSYFIEPIGRCEDTEEAKASARGPSEYCKVSPNIAAFGIEFVFNNLLDPTSVELVRKRPDNPNLFEVYDWKTQILEIEGPITRFNGDYFVGRAEAPDIVTRAVNLSCIDNLADKELGFSHEDYADPQTNPCNRIDADTGLPMKMQVQGHVWSTRGRWDSRAVARAGARSCDSPEDGADSCCNQCDFTLSTKVAKYGVRSLVDPGSGEALTGAGLLSRDNLRLPQDGSAIQCDPLGDPYLQCHDFNVGVDRSDETHRYEYAWECDPADPGCARATHLLPLYDRLRQTHPQDRPAWLERGVGSCAADFECADEQSPYGGYRCIGTNAEGQACQGGTDDCTDAQCRPPWFVTCRADILTTGEQGYCVDTRFESDGAGACYIADAEYTVCNEEGKNCRDAPAGNRVAHCDWDQDGTMTAEECCQASLGDATEDGLCDPIMQPALTPVPRYSRNGLLPTPSRDCLCTELSQASDDCREAVAANCLDDEGNVREGREGEFAVKFVTRNGGVIYDPAIKGFEWRPADLGGVPRAGIESCAENRGNIAPRNIADGWRAHDAFDQEAENYEDFDRAMCSGSEYTIRFSVPDGDGPVEHVRDKLGNTLEDKAEYVIETPQFHVVPDSGFPTENLRIGACDDFLVTLSNKYDLSPENLAKLQIWSIDEEGSFAEPQPGCGLVPVAGGPGCAATEDERAAKGDCHPPCLVVDLRGSEFGQVGVRIDPAEFGRVLETGRRYRLWIPGLSDIDEMSDAELYSAAFWDACGMPLVLGTPSGSIEYAYDFGIDEPKCKEDIDRDNVQFSCDNADEVFNPDQADIDADGVGDVIDLCPTVPGSLNNSADSDRDGVGNDCDACRQTTKQYNDDAPSGVSAAMLVRNNPLQTDTDHDGIGDVCDNCIHVANCEGYGADDPWRPGDPIAYEDDNLCQRDDDRDLIGDACQGMMAEDAAGPVGLLADDDFDQDGIVNLEDGCPRVPVGSTVGRIACETDEDCPGLRVCEPLPDGVGGDTVGWCDHIDTDDDGVGDECDTCPFAPNPMQIVDGVAQAEDEDGDFVGRDCETFPQCEDRADPRPFAFYEVSSVAACCTTLLVEEDGLLVNAITGRALEDPDRRPVTLDCTEADEVSGLCRALPSKVRFAPGVVELPAGCEEALADAGYDDPRDNPRLTPDEAGGLDALWDSLCLLPQLDQDFDGVGDMCDLCEFDFDPENQQFIDGTGRLWPRAGKFCNGEYDIESKCADDEDAGSGSGGSGSGGAGSGEPGTGGTG